MKFFIVVFHFSSRSLQNRSVYYKTLSNCLSRFLDGSGNRMDDWILKTTAINKQRSYPVELWRRKTWVQRRKESQNRAQNCSGWFLQKLYYRRHLDLDLISILSWLERCIKFKIVRTNHIAILIGTKTVHTKTWFNTSIVKILNLYIMLSCTHL